MATVKNDNWWYDVLGHSIEEIRRYKALKLNDTHREILSRMKRSLATKSGDFPYRGSRGGFPRHWSGYERELTELTRAGYLREEEYFQGSRWVLTRRAKELSDA